MQNPIFESDSYKYKKYVCIKGTKTIKIVKEVETYKDDYVLYMSDGTSYGINQCESLEDVILKT